MSVPEHRHLRKHTRPEVELRSFALGGFFLAFKIWTKGVLVMNIVKDGGHGQLTSIARLHKAGHP